MLMGLVAYTLSSCFDFPLERINHQVWLAVLLAAILVTKHSVTAPARPAAWALPWRYALPPALVALGFGVAYALAALSQERHMVLSRRAIRDKQWQGVVDEARLATTPWKTLDAFVTPIAYLEAVGQIKLGNLPAATACLERARRDNPNGRGVCAAGQCGRETGSSQRQHRNRHRSTALRRYGRLGLHERQKV
jgi:hypothetical protein